MSIQFDTLDYAHRLKQSRLEAKIDAMGLKIEARFVALSGEISLLKRMVGTSLVLNVAIVLKLFL